MKTSTRTITILWKSAVGLFLILLIGYLAIGFFLPAPDEPEPIGLNGSTFESLFQPFDGQFVSVYVTKTISSEESLRYLQEWERLNSGFDKRDLTELVGFDKPLSNLSSIRCLVMIDCRNGKFLRFKEEFFHQNGRLIHGVSSNKRHNAWMKISKTSIIDELAIRFCEPSAY